jgi:exodeoxyribonuclease VII large subunit
MNTGEIFSISALNQTARLLLEEGLGTIWVQGEISNFSAPSSGHWYFSLKDADAQVRAAMFINKNRCINFAPKNGMQVLALAQVSLYENRGEYQLIIEKLESVGQGTLQLEFERLRRTLAEQGLFDNKHKKSLPPLPQCIGLITSATGAALQDMLQVLKRRAPHIAIIIYPAAVQGLQAAPQLIAALQTANYRKECEVLIIARGGGSLEDLWPFNEESLVRAVFASTIPIISGVGHEIDFTLCDLAADVRAPTPSAAAELVSIDQQELSSQLHYLQQKLTDLLQQKIQALQQECSHLAKRLKHPKDYLQQLKQQVDFYELHIKQLIEAKLDTQRHTLSLHSQALHNLSPLNILTRGYAIALDEQARVVSSIAQLKPNAKIALRLQDGQVEAKVLNIDPTKNVTQ